MEENKYYTPELSEFHHLFEFEIHNSKGRYFVPGIKEGWYSTYMDFGILGDIQNLQKLILDKQVRVPFLSKEDIEAEGCTFVDEGEYKIDAYFSKKVEFKQGIIEYRIRLWGHNKVNIWSEDTNSTYFEGVIKNKSVFKQVLKMIGI